MDKDGNITIKDFQAGVADSPLLGFAKMNNVDIYEKPGTLKLQFASTLSFSTASLPIACQYDKAGNQYVLTKAGVIWKNGSSWKTISGGYTFCDMAIFETKESEYSFTVTGTPTCAVGDTYTNNGITFVITSVTSGTLKAIGSGDPKAGSGTLTKDIGSGDTTIAFSAWTVFYENIEYMLLTTTDYRFTYSTPLHLSTVTLWTTSGPSNNRLSTNSFKKILVGIDLDATDQPIIYIGNGNNVASITNWTYYYDSSVTFDVNKSALALQPGYWAYNLNNLGKYLAIGCTGEGAGIYDTISNKNSALILWDRSSTSFNLPIFWKENGITSSLQMQNRLYLAIGNRGRIFVTDGTNFEQVKRIPFVYNRQFGNYAYIYPNAMTLHNGDILVGVSGTGTDATYGVYAMSITPAQVGNSEIPYPTIMRNSPSTGGTGSSQQLNIGFLYSTGADTLIIGWQDGTSYGVDTITSTVTSGYKSVIYSPYYEVGTELSKKTYKRMEISLTTPLLTGQKIKVSYRENLNGTWTQIGEYTSTNFGTNNVYNCPANLASKVKLQLKIEFDTTTTNNIEFQSLRIYG